MNEFRLLFAVIRRDQEQAYIDCLKRHGAGAIFSTLCEGAARRNTLDLLGLEPNEKAMISTMVSARTARLLTKRLVSEMRIDAPNSGIAMTVNVDGIGGASALQYLCGDQHLIHDDEVTEMNEIEYSLIVAVADKGQHALVLDAARSAGAMGGTLVHAKEIGVNPVLKFFGVSIAEEKEQIYMVVPYKLRDPVLRAIMEQAGVRSPAHAVAFSLPVDEAVGLTIPED